MAEKTNKLKRTQGIYPKEGKDAEILIKSRFVKEDLPFPYVLYPNLGGTFIGFSSERSGQIFFCSCSELAIDNYVKLSKQLPKEANSSPNVMNLLSSHEFPPLIAEKSPEFKENPKTLIQFKDKICHKCNLATPAVRAVSSIYGGKFKQYYGWYINQQYFHLGIWNQKGYLKEYCPDEIISLIERGKIAEKAASYERLRLIELAHGPKREDISNDEITYWRNVKIEEADAYKRLDKKSRKLQLELSNKIENIVRQEFGFRKVGDGWISESILYKIVQRLFPNKQIIRHHRPEWLSGLELDIFIPEIKLAFEYQGKQHYYPVKAWGGKKGLEKVQERDKKKRLICAQMNIKLIIVDYTEPLTEDHIKELIKTNSITKNN